MSEVYLRRKDLDGFLYSTIATRTLSPLTNEQNEVTYKDSFHDFSGVVKKPLVNICASQT